VHIENVLDSLFLGVISVNPRGVFGISSMCLLLLKQNFDQTILLPQKFDQSYSLPAKQEPHVYFE